MKKRNVIIFVLMLVIMFAFSACKKATLTGITLDTKEAQLTFSPNEEFNYDGLKVVASYDDDSLKEVSSFTVDSSAFKKGELGQYEIKVSYSENGVDASASYKVKVSLGALQSITLDTTDVKKVFYLGEDFTYEGLRVNANYNGYSEEVTDYKVSSFNYKKDERGTYSITVEYSKDGFSQRAYYSVVVKGKLDDVNELIGLDVYFGNQEAVFKTVSVLDETKYDYNDLVVEAVYLDGTTKVLNSNEYTLKNENVDLNKRGSYEVVVSYSENYKISDSETITITEENFFLILVENKATEFKFVSGKTSFTAEEEATAEDWVFEVTLENGDKETVTYEQVKVESFPFISGTYQLNVTYNQEQMNQDSANISLKDTVEITIAEPVDEGGVKTYQFGASQLSAEGVNDKATIAAGTAFARGYFTVFGNVTQRLNSSLTATSSIEVGKGGSGGLQFTVNGTAEVTLSMGSTGGSNTSAVGIVDTSNNLIANKEGITHAVGTSETIMTYTLTTGIYKIVSPADKEYDRAARVYSVIVVETPSEGGQTITNYFFDSATIEVTPGQEDKLPLPEGTTFLAGFFKTFGAVVQRLNANLNATSYVEVGADETSGITFTITGTAEVVINVSSTGGTNASSVGIIDSEGNTVVNDQNVTVVEGTGVIALTYTLEAGTYSVVSLNDTDDTRDRGARVYTISVLETKKGA